MEMVSLIIVAITVALVLHLLRNPAKPPEPKQLSPNKLRVPAEVVPEVGDPTLSFRRIPSQGARPFNVPKEEKREVMRDPDTIQFTVDLKAFVRCALNDPKCREEIYAAIREGANTQTEVLGAANLGPKGGPDEWFSLFIATDRRVSPGAEGFVFRNQRGDRISARLRRQVRKDHPAVEVPSQPLPLELQGDTQLLTRALLEQNPEAARALLQLGLDQRAQGAAPTGQGEVPEESGGNESPFSDLEF